MLIIGWVYTLLGIELRTYMMSVLVTKNHQPSYTWLNDLGSQFKNLRCILQVYFVSMGANDLLVIEVQLCNLSQREWRLMNDMWFIKK
jgi:hypothetical protein